MKKYENLEKIIKKASSKLFASGSAESKIFIESHMAAIKVIFSRQDFLPEEFLSRFSIDEQLSINDEEVDLDLFFFVLSEEIKAYKKLKGYEEDRQEEIERWLSNGAYGANWEECLEIVEHNISKIEETGSDKAIFEPEGDARYRVYKSIKLWVLNKWWEESGEKYQHIGVMDEIERKVFRFTSGGECVRYQNRYYLVHSRFEFSSMLAAVRRGEVYLFSNIHYSSDLASDIVSKDFICLQ